MTSGPNEDFKENDSDITNNTGKIVNNKMTIREKIENGEQLKVFVGKGNNDKLIQSYFTNEYYINVS